MGVFVGVLGVSGALESLNFKRFWKGFFGNVLGA